MRRYLIIFFFAFVFANLIAIDVWVLQNGIQQSNVSEETMKREETALPSPTIIIAKPCDFSCPQSCVDKINEATKSFTATEATPAVTTIVKTVTVPPISTQFKESYVLLTGGSGQGNDWQGIDASKTMVDLSRYGKIKQVVFEIVGRMVDDNASATVRLYNVNDKRVVDGSEISFGKLSCQLAGSAPFGLEATAKTYQIQIKTTANAIAYVDQARLRIVTE